MLMSKSRLEKFLYALYSLDSSDLPNPLSRIEQLYNCWVTGEEAPSFKPLSRVEKYLMAILGGYDVDELPNPLSRVEVLLYKLATGDDNLDDVKSFLSEHEELLADIIRNGGTGGNIDIEYVLYNLSTEFNTLYNTAEKPVKSAILKGNTLVNLIQTIGKTILEQYQDVVSLIHVKPSTKYLLKIKNNTSEAKSFYSSEITEWTQIDIEANQTITKTLTTKSILGRNTLLQNLKTHTTEHDLSIIFIEYQDGMENWDIPYFEGMQSVKMPVLTTTGKNLFDMKDIDKDDFELNKYQTAYYGKEFILKPNTKYTIKAYLREDITDTSVWIVFNIINNNSILEVINIDKTGISGTNVINQVTFTTDSTGKVGYSMYSHNQSERSWLGNLPFDIQLEKGSTATSYEPYKSNILTVNEEVELRVIGNVQDELDLVTGEVIERIGEVVLDGSEKWMYTPKDTYVIFALRRTDYGELLNIKQGSIIVSDRYPSGNSDNNITGGSGYVIQIFKPLNVTLEEFKNELGSNPATVQYQLATESIKTVDLSVVDQDGNDTKLSTFNDITHVTLSSEGLIPEAELEVATKNEEVLNTLSLEMDDISTTQNTLEETSNVQSENVDATMIATTEIYEELL